MNEVVEKTPIEIYLAIKIMMFMFRLTRNNFPRVCQLEDIVIAIIVCPLKCHLIQKKFPFPSFPSLLNACLSFEIYKFFQQAIIV